MLVFFFFYDSRYPIILIFFPYQIRYEFFKRGNDILVDICIDAIIMWYKVQTNEETPPIENSIGNKILENKKHLYKVIFMPENVPKCNLGIIIFYLYY